LRNNDPVIALLRRVPGLAGAEDRELAKLAPLVDLINVRAGQALARQGEIGREACIVVEGHGEVLIDDDLIATVGPGDFVGEMAMLESGTRCATVRALTPMRVLVIGPQAFGTFTEQPGTGRALALQLSQRLRRAEPAAQPR
jgi:CRP-like cAMP-binding protein